MSFEYEFLYEELRKAIDENPDYIKQLNYNLENTFLTSFLIAAAVGFKSDDPEVAAGYRTLKAEASERALHVMASLFMFGFTNSVHGSGEPLDRFVQSFCRTLGAGMNEPVNIAFDASFVNIVSVNLNATGEAVCDLIRDKIPMTDAQKKSIDVFVDMFRSMAAQNPQQTSYEQIRDTVRANLESIYNGMLGPRPNPSIRAN